MLDAVEHIKNGAYPFWSLHLAKADLLGSNDDVLWVAEMLAKHGHENPFELIEGLIEPSNYRAFLVAIRLGGENLRTEQDVVIYLCNKLHKNGPKPSSRITDMKAEVE